MGNLSSETQELLRHLSSMPGHDEVKADFRDLLVREFGVSLPDLSFEERVPMVSGRLDALVGRTVFEAKSNLEKEIADVERRMPDYLSDREREHGEPFVGIASDGRGWKVFDLSGGKLRLIKEMRLDSERGEAFLAWLDGVLALRSSLPPDALNIKAELGQDSVAYHFVSQELRRLWDAVGQKQAEGLKRQLWSDLLKLVYGREMGGDSLWFQHTYLVIVAKCIAFAVSDPREDDPAKLMSGEAFAAAGINGAVESDFFDWVLAAPGGGELVRRIMSHVRRFRLNEVESDVLKILYESLIDRTERHGLGEYYTPDWLAAKVVRRAVREPLRDRVLDPACGSGTFLFHAVRNALAEAEESGMAPAEQAAEATRLVAGIDIHPVAVIIARVTYVLALVPVLRNRSGPVSIPVYLGDAMQLNVPQDMVERELVVHVPPPRAGEGWEEELPIGREKLVFPETFCRDPGLFDKAIERMRTGTLEELSRPQIEAALKRITEQHYKSDLTNEQALAIGDLGRTYETFDRLRREGRDTIWAYVARNLSRPLAFAADSGWANVIVGNPPWVAFRHMSDDLQKRFKELAKGERVYVGGKLATQNDLSALFTVRASHLYLRPSGTIAFVLPLAAMTRGQFDKFRRGSFSSYAIAWEEAWTMDDSVEPLFPVPSCVMIGRKRATARKAPERVRAYSGTLPMRDAPEELADRRLTVRENAPAPTEAKFEGGSPYRSWFRQGATLVPRMLCFVERKPVGRLGGNASAPIVTSRRSPLEKPPWKHVDSLEGQIGIDFLRPALLGESILPHRLFKIFEAVIPVADDGRVLDAEAAASAKRGHDSLAAWMRKAEAVWEKNKSASTKVSLSSQFDFYGKLASQFPIAPLRIVYAKAGTQPAACVIRDERAVIDHKLYWYVPESEPEAHYLCAILNSETARSRVEAYQSRGQFGTRDFDKVMFNLPIPHFKSAEGTHQRLAQLGAEAETAAANVELVDGEKFQRARRRVRDGLIEIGLAERIEAAVAALLK